MGFLKLFEKIRPTFDAFLDKLFARSNSSKNSKHINSDFFSDEFVRTNKKNAGPAPISKKIYVNGKEFNVVAFSQEELDVKLQSFGIKPTPVQPSDCLDPTKLMFSNLYTEQKTDKKINEWSEKRDVWIDEYCPA